MPSENDNIKNHPKNGLDETEEVKIKVNYSGSSVAEFTKRKLPDENQLNEFEEYIEEEAKEEEIDESLNEIYRDDKGGIVNVQMLEIKRKHGFIFWFLSMLFFFSGLAAAAYIGYGYYLKLNSNITAMEFAIQGRNEVIAGEEITYSIAYKNNSQIAAKDARIEAILPENFIFLESTPTSTEKNKIWNIGLIDPMKAGKITIKGKIIGPVDTANITLANMTYMPANFSSEFKKEATITSWVKNLGLNFDIDYFSSSLVGEENEINVKYSTQENNFINDFRITMPPQENLEFIKYLESGSQGNSFVTQSRPGVWQVNGAARDEIVLPIKFKFLKKMSDKQTINIIFEKSEGGKFYKFYEKALEYEVMKSDLNLTLIVNGAREDSGIDFGQTLNYSIIYTNKGETDMKDVVIMAVLTSEFLDWNSLSDKQGGKRRTNTLSWTKDEVPELKNIAKNQDGTIDFSIKVAPNKEINPAKAYEVKSYAQFTIGNYEDFKDSSDNKSNTIVNKIKSDMKLDEQVRYFSEDNIPVGVGPNPPKVGEKTTYRVYWKLSNNLHELNVVEVRIKLPDYASFEDKNNSTIGSILFDESAREVIWRIGRLPVTTYQANAEWNIGITPAETDRNKILVITPITKAKAFDTATKENLEFFAKARTTKLEDDEIGANDGMVQ